MYIPGRRRTCSTPSRTWMSSDVYELFWLFAAATFPPTHPAHGGPKLTFSEGSPRGGEYRLEYTMRTPPPGGLTPLRNSCTATVSALHLLPLEPVVDHHADPANMVPAKCPVCPLLDLARQEPHLGSPGSGGGDDGEHSRLQPDRPALPRQPLADDLRPRLHQPAETHPLRELLLRQQPGHQVADRRDVLRPHLRIAGLRSAAPLGLPPLPLGLGRPRRERTRAGQVPGRAAHVAPRSETAPARTRHTRSATSGTCASSATDITVCPRPARRPAKRRWRTGSSPGNGSSRSSTGGSPTSASTAAASPRRSDSAAAQASPCEANARAPRSFTRRSCSSRWSPETAAVSPSGTDGAYRMSSPYPVSASNSAPARPPTASATAARSRVSAAPVRTSSASQASSPGGAPRPSQSLSSRFRCRSAFSYATSSGSRWGHSTEIDSSRKARRESGCPWTTSRSPGEKNTERTNRRTSRRRRTGERLTWIRFAPEPRTSTSINARPSRPSTSPRT